VSEVEAVLTDLRPYASGGTGNVYRCHLDGQEPSWDALLLVTTRASSTRRPSASSFFPLSKMVRYSPLPSSELEALTS
jgi:hypothetical protein